MPRMVTDSHPMGFMLESRRSCYVIVIGLTKPPQSNHRDPQSTTLDDQVQWLHLAGLQLKSDVPNYANSQINSDVML